MREYRALNKQFFISGRYALVPIRFEDRFKIMKWRNEQIYHLRQAKPLTKEDQDAYFENVVSKLFDQEQPNQILFSFLEDGVCIGYGGVVHINWLDKNAEISYLMDTTLEKNRFQELWLSYLELMDEVAFNSLLLHKIYTYAFDLRPHLYDVLCRANYFEDSRLKEHAFFGGRAIDVVIHSKINKKFALVPVSENDFDITFHWASDKIVRQFSFNKLKFSLDEHKRWLLNKITDPNCYYYILTRGAEKVGSIRVDYNEINQSGLISYLIGSEYHGNGYGTKILQLIEELVANKFEVIHLTGLVMSCNKASVRIFNKLGYDLIYDKDEILTFSKTIKSENRII
jgi:RimJ/RimL family protein N-acetyltransferase